MSRISHFLLAFVLTTTVLLSQSMQKSVISSGGTKSTSGAIVLNATTGQPAVGVTQTQGLSALQGFWYTPNQASSKILTATEKENFTVSPSPMNGIVDIRFMPPCEGNVSIQLFSIIGKKVTTLYSDFATTLITTSLDSREFSNGTYVLRIITPCDVRNELITVKN